MWLLEAFGSAFLAGITAILAKCSIKNTDSDVVTAVRTVVVLIFAWIMAFIAGSEGTIKSISAKTWVFLILSGLATGASWLCYFKALSQGDVNKVVPIDKSSIILTLILAFVILHEPISWIKGIAIVLIGTGTFFMIEKKKDTACAKKSTWLIYAVMSAVFASLTSILGKIGIEGVESNLGTAIRTCVVLIMAWLMVAIKGKIKSVKEINGKELVFILLSGLATGGSWLCYYSALKNGPASVVVPVDKLSILVTTAFSWIVFREKLSAKAAVGLVFITVGTLLMIV